MSNKTADACYKFVKGDGPEPYSPAVAALFVFVDAIEEAAFKRGFEACAGRGSRTQLVLINANEAWKRDIEARR